MRHEVAVILQGETMQSQDTLPNTVILLGVYKILLALFLLCVGAAAIGCGALTGLVASLAGQSGEAEAAVATGLVSLISSVAGILSLLCGVAAIVVAVGLFTRKPWSYMGALILNGAVIVLQILNLLAGGLGIPGLVFVVLSGVAIYILLNDQATKQALGQS